MITSTYVNLAASALVKTGPGTLMGLILTAGADTATVTIYDEVSGSGDVIAKLSATANVTVGPHIPPIAFGVGCYATITGTTPSITVFYI